MKFYVKKDFLSPNKSLQRLPKKYQFFFAIFCFRPQCKKKKRKKTTALGPLVFDQRFWSIPVIANQVDTCTIDENYILIHRYTDLKVNETINR